MSDTVVRERMLQAAAELIETGQMTPALIERVVVEALGAGFKRGRETGYALGYAEGDQASYERGWDDGWDAGRYQNDSSE